MSAAPSPSPAPLAPTKQLPPMIPTFTPAAAALKVKRVLPEHASSASSGLQAKRSKRTATSTTANTNTKKSQQLGDFAIPPLPMRHRAPLTPSTSTVAHSSSPPRLAPSSPSTNNPANRAAAIPSVIEHDLTVQPGQSLLFGRHRHSLALSAPSDEESSTLASAVPAVLRHLLACPDNAFLVKPLSRMAKHASRLHACIEYVAAADEIRVVVLGQNGVRVRQGQSGGVGSKGKAVRLLQGQRMGFARSSADVVEVDFYGSRVRLAFPPRVVGEVDVVMVEEEAGEERSRLFTPSSDMEMQDDAPPSPVSSMPPSSPPLLPESHDEEERERRASSPLSNLGDEEPEVATVEVAAATDKEIKREMLDSVQEVGKGSEQPEAAVEEKEEEKEEEEELKPAPADVDFEALLAATIVFSGSSKLSLPDLVKHMLEAQPSLRSHGDEDDWARWCLVVLERGGMFGKVQRHGKDASGHPLLPHYFYAPDLDTDAGRAKELGGLVRPLRAAQRGGGKAIDWRPVGRARRY